MDDVDHDHHGRIRRTLKERLGLKGMGCCGGPTWGFRSTTTPINATDSEEEEQQLQQQNHHHHHQLQLHLQLQLQEDQQEQISNQVSDPGCFSPAPVLNSSGNSMNLAAALAAERHFRAVEGTNNLEASPTPVDVINNNNNSNTSSSVGSGGGGGGGNNVGLMITAPGTPMRVSLMRLLAETDGGDVEGERRAVGGGVNDTVCCVCMVRKKGAAFIPCGHTFCRVCSREVWLNRGSCPLCNRSILEILDIF